MEACLIVCKCGRILRHKQWVWVTNTFSKVIGDMVKRNSFDGMAEIELLIEECEFCQQKGDENGKERVL